MELTLNQKIWTVFMIDFARDLAEKINIEIVRRYTRQNPQGLSARQLPPIPDKWTWRSGRLGRSLLNARWRSGESENIFEIKKLGKEMIFTIGSAVPYARVHEYGAKIIGQWRGKNYTRVKPFTIPARPYFRPAIRDMAREKWGVQVFEQTAKKYKDVILKLVK